MENEKEVEKIEGLTIRFSRKYTKLEGVGETATLLYVSLINLETPEMLNFYKEFLDYDNMANGLAFVPIYGEYIVCLFKGETGKLFTAMKPKTEENITKYFYSVGKTFEVVINGK